MIIILFLQIGMATDFRMEFSYPMINLATLAPGFINPGEGKGLAGMVMNPASINDLGKGEVFLAFSPSISSSFNSSFTIPIEGLGSISDSIILPVDFTFRDHGHLDFVGMGLRREEWAFGLAFIRGDYLRLASNGEARLEAHHEIEFDDTLTHELIESLPAGEEIPVRISLSGSGAAGVIFSGYGQLQSQGIALAGGVHEAGLDLGLGLQVEPIRVEAHLDGNLSGGLDAAAQTKVSSEATEWRVDAQFDGEVYEDSLIFGTLDCLLKGIMVRFVTGIKKNFRFLDIGGCYQYLLPTTLKGHLDYYYQYPEDLPTIDIEGESLHVDTVNHRITGKGRIVIRKFPKIKEREHRELSHSFPHAHGLFLGVGLKLHILKLALFGGTIQIPDRSYLRTILGANLSLKIFIPIEGTIVYSYQGITVEDIPITSLPVVGINVGTNFKIRNLHIYLGGGVNTTQGAATLILPEMMEGKKTRENLVGVRFGLGYEF
ncbi:hypothetical protein DRP53_00920 [candidate division WOR-3 bacterium]|uniref:DUF5723 domain-containing protein n=1 Tax=candidate division WOR-3 bacterium TaxID=2052148 RepID=A0A660SLH1_UNCW3|nr:MAG: hypothetical protein DRP53_00920 [candidate division WOR-3 bacterium]